MAPGIPTLDPERESLATLREFQFFTLARLISEQPHTAAQVVAYTKFGDKLNTCMQTETALRDAMVLADAEAIACDNVLNGLLRQLSTAIHGGKQPDVSLPKHQLYFGSQTPEEAARPILSSQLDLMAGWPKLLVKETQPAFVDLLAPITLAVQSGVNAREKIKDTRAANAKFRLDGERTAIFDEYNALASSTYGELGAFAQLHPELGLPADWASSCFRHISRDPGPQTVAEVDALLEKLDQQRQALVTKRAVLAQKEADKASAETEAKEAEAALKEADDEEAAAKKKKKDAIAKAKLAKKKAKKK
jgi:hypothetical protein